jgi:hypothetical protein
MDLLSDLDFQYCGTFASNQCTRVFTYLGRRILFTPDVLRIMSSPHERLSDLCINGIAAILHDTFSHSSYPSSHHARQCVIFTTYDLPMVRYNATDADVWRRTHHLEYWNKRFWILPIHRTHPHLHWVLCCISPYTRELFLFDSLSERSPWKHERKVSISLVCHYHL